MQAQRAATFVIQAILPLLFALLLLPSDAHADQTASESSATAQYAQCTQQHLENLRQQALAAYQNQGKTEQAAQAAMELLQDAIDADCLNLPESPSSDSQTPPADLAAATAYSWLLNDSMFYLLHAPQKNIYDDMYNNDYTCLSALTPLLDEDYTPVTWLPENLRRATTHNTNQLIAHCTDTITRANYWQNQVSQANRYTAQAPCPFDSTATRLNDNLCIHFDTGLYPEAAERMRTSDDDVPLPDCDASPTAQGCPVFIVSTRTGGHTTTTRFAASQSALADISNTCTFQHIGVNAAGDQFALLAPYGYDCFGGSARFSIEEIYEIQHGKPVLVRNNSMGFH